MPVPTPRRLLIAAAVTAALLAPAALAQRAGEAAPIAPVAPGSTAHLRDNAALLYWRAFSLMGSELQKTISELSPSISDRIFNLDLNQRAALQHTPDIIDHLMRAAEMDRCEFALDYDRWPDTLLPHLGAMRNSVRLLAIDARIKLNAGDTDAAVDRVAAAIRMSRHAADDHTLICSLVSVAMFAVTDAVLQAALPPDSLTPGQRARIADALAQFSAEDPFRTRASVAMEARLTSTWVRARLADPDSRRELIHFFTADDGMSDNLAHIIESGQPLHAEADLLTAAYAQTLVAWDSDDPVKSLNIVKEQLEEGAFGAVAPSILPALSNARRSDLRAQAQLRDAIARYR